MASVTRDQLYRPVQETARLLALAWLAEADAALARLPDSEDTEALHDFRVSLRRFRSSVRAYQPYLKGSAPKKARRRMGTLASGTNPGRDAEVQIAWLESLRQALAPGELAGWQWLATQAEKRPGTPSDRTRLPRRQTSGRTPFLRLRSAAVTFSLSTSDAHIRPGDRRADPRTRQRTAGPAFSDRVCA
jgi:hypothetical protein